jgi:hypothetical protein
VILLTLVERGNTANLRATCPIRADFHVIVTEHRSLVCVVVHTGLPIQSSVHWVSPGLRRAL